MPNIKIAEICADLEEIGGIQKQIQSIGKEFSLIGYDVIDICLNTKKSLKSIQKKDYGTLLRIKKLSKINNKIINTLNAIYFSIMLLKKLKEIRPGIIHHHAYYIPALFLLVQSFFLKIPYVITLHRGETVDSPYFFKKILKWIINRSRSTIAVGSHLKNVYVRMGINEAKIKVIYNGVDADFFSKRYDYAEYIKEEILRSKNIIKIITFRRLVKKNGLDLLIEAFAEVHFKFQDTWLFIGGVGPELEFLKKFARDHKIEQYVVFLGDVKESLLPYYYSAADVYVSPSLSEGFSLGALEAMACECPVVISRTGDLKDLAPNSAIFVKPGNVSDLVGALTQIVQDRDLRARLIRNSRSFLQQMTWASISRQILKVYLNR